MTSLLLALARWFASHVLLPDKRARAIAGALLIVHLRPWLKGLLIVVLGLAPAIPIAQNASAVNANVSVHAVALILSLAAYAVVQVPVLVVMHLHSRRRAIAMELDNLLATCLRGYDAQAEWISPRFIDDTLCAQIVDDVRNATGPIYVLSPNGVYFCADKIERKARELISSDEKGRAILRALDAMKKQASSLREEFEGHPGKVHFMMPDFRDANVRALCRLRRKAIGADATLDRYIGRMGRGVLRTLRFRRWLNKRDTQVVRFPHFLFARLLLVDDRIYIQCMPTNSCGILQPVNVLNRAEHPERFYVLRHVIHTLAEAS